MKLFKKENHLLVSNLLVADTFWSKQRGLLGRQSLETNSAMWIQFCDCIHTFFMKFPIDVVFVDKKMKIKKISHDVVPWRLTRIVFTAQSVIEFPAGKVQQLGLREGDQLYVVD